MMKLILNNGVELELMESIVTGSYAIDGVVRNSLSFQPKNIANIDELTNLLTTDNLQKITYNYNDTYIVYYDYTILVNIQQDRRFGSESEHCIITVTLVQTSNTEKALAQLRADIDFIAIMQEVPL